MITGFVRNLVSFGGTSTFEKARLAATYKGDQEPPNEWDIQAILLTLSGKDPETRPQVGYTTIVAKLESSQSKYKWNYILKNLIILDRCVDERFFVQDISSLQSHHVQTYVESDPSMKNLQIEPLIRQYFQYIRAKAFLYSKKTTSFNMSREEKKIYFQAQTVCQIFEELILSQKLHDIIMELGATDRTGHLKFKINQYVYLLLLYTLTNIYSTQFMAILALLEKLLTMDLESTVQFKSLYTRFLKQNEQLIYFITNHQFIKGYSDINVQDFQKVDSRIITSIEDYIKLQQKQITNGLPEEVMLDTDLIQEELVFETIHQVRNSIQQFNQQENDNHNPDDHKQLRKNIVRQDTFKRTISDNKRITRPFNDQLNKLHDHMGDQTIFMPSCFDNYSAELFNSFIYNFSTHYMQIDQKFTISIFNDEDILRSKPSSIPKLQRFSFEYDPIEYKLEELIAFTKPEPFQETLFIVFENSTCFDIKPSPVKHENAAQFEDFQYMEQNQQGNEKKHSLQEIDEDAFMDMDAFEDFDDYEDDK